METAALTRSFTNVIPPTAPYVVVDSRTGQIVYRTTYANARRARNWADRKDNDFGGVRFICRLA